MYVLMLFRGCHQDSHPILANTMQKSGLKNSLKKCLTVDFVSSSCLNDLAHSMP